MGATSRQLRTAPEVLIENVSAGPLLRFRLIAPTIPILASALSGCILPLAPEFQAVENAPPYVVRADPRIGAQVQSEDMSFVVTVRDPNPGDRLYARWLVDYPRSDMPATLPGREDVLPAPDEPNVPNEQTLRFKPECALHGITNATTQHQLMLVVADRPFIAETDLKLPNYWDSTPTSAGVVYSVWEFRKACR